MLALQETLWGCKPNMLGNLRKDNLGMLGSMG
jgi:hypothetical protein